MDFQREIEDGLRYAQETLGASARGLEPRSQKVAALALAALAALAVSERRDARERETTDDQTDEPQTINFERAKARLNLANAARTRFGVDSRARRALATEGRRLRLYCGECVDDAR